MEGTAPTPASSATPAAPSASQAAAAALPPAALPTAPSAPASHAWDVHEAPASACFKFRVGAMELLYTLRGIDDAELQRRMMATLPTLQEIMEACEERAAREAARAQQAPAAAVPQADLQALLQQAVQQALAAANGQATPPPQAPPNTGTAQPAPTPEGWCALHQVPMEQRSNERGSWWSHRLADGSYCKGK